MQVTYVGYGSLTPLHRYNVECILEPVNNLNVLDCERYSNTIMFNRCPLRQMPRIVNRF